LWLVLNGAGLKIDLVSSTLAAYAVVAIAQIPVSIGGAGITELSMQSYLIALYGFTSWSSIVLWRVASYQVLLAVTGIIFVFFVRRASNPSRVENKQTIQQKTAGLTAREVEKVISKLGGRKGLFKTFRFALAGALGFLVTEIVLATGLLLFYGKLTFEVTSFSSSSLLWLDILAFIAGVTASFLINERLIISTPSIDKRDSAKKLIRFLKFQAVSGLGTAGIIATQLVLLVILEVSPLVGTFIGAVVTFPIIYLISLNNVWQSPSLPE